MKILLITDQHFGVRNDNQVFIEKYQEFYSETVLPFIDKNKTKDPVVSAAPHPYFDYEKKVFTKDGREEYMKEQKK